MTDFVDELDNKLDINTFERIVIVNRINCTVEFINYL